MAGKKRGWKAISGFSLADLRKIFEQKEKQISALSTRRDELAAELADVEAQLTAATGGGSSPEPSVGRKVAAVKAPAPKKRGRRKGGTRGPRGEGGLQNMIRNVLAEAKEPVKLAAIADRVLAAGYQTGSTRFGVIVGQRLSEMKDVKKAGRGLYAMK